MHALLLKAYGCIKGFKPSPIFVLLLLHTSLNHRAIEKQQTTFINTTINTTSTHCTYAQVNTTVSASTTKKSMHLKSPQRSVATVSLILILMTTAMAAPTPSEGEAKGEGPSTRDTNIYDTTLELDQGAIRDGRVNPYSVYNGSSSANAANGK